MNCQDVSRIVDTGSFSRLTEVDRREAEAHALTCRHCAPVWAVHARLADLRIPPMPRELAVRCRALAALPVHPHGRRALSRLTVVGSLVALAAAAGMLTMLLARTQAPESQHSTVTARAAKDHAPLATAETAAPVVSDAILSAPPAMKPSAASPDALPLFPLPVFFDAVKAQAASDLALRKVVERYPELVEGPEIDGTFVVAATMRADGRIVNSAIRLPTSADLRDVNAELARTLPQDAGSVTTRNLQQRNPLPDGRSLRADVTLHFSIVSNDYDVTRSSLRVHEIVRSQHADLMLPVDKYSGGKVNLLTIFMSEDGAIQREDVQKIDLETGDSARTNNPDNLPDSNDADRLAERIASKLGLDVGQLGLLGSLTVEDGSLSIVIDEDGHPTMEDKRHRLVVNYAWPRRAGESAPFIGQGDIARPKFDQAAALAIVRRQIPDAFTMKDPEAGTPTVVLTVKGELVRAGRVHMQNGGALNDLLQEQLVPGIRTSSFMSQVLRDETGATASVMFAWEMPARPTATK